MIARLLWVDDEIDMLRAHILFLEKKDYEVVTANNGPDAIDLCREENFDLVLLDENMPGLSGLETLTRLKDVAPNVPVVMVTKNEEEDIMDQAIGSKIADYLLKPVNRKTFEATMERVEEQLKAKPPVTHLAKAQSPGTVDSSWHVAFGNPAVTMDRRLIAYALSNAHYVEFTFADGTQTKIRTNFSDVDQRLTVFDNFYRTARGVLVNFDYVSGITNAQFVMKGGKRIPITKTAVTTTCRAYAEYTFTRMRTED